MRRTIYLLKSADEKEYKKHAKKGEKNRVIKLKIPTGVIYAEKDKEEVKKNARRLNKEEREYNYTLKTIYYVEEISLYD